MRRYSPRIGRRTSLSKDSAHSHRAWRDRETQSSQQGRPFARGLKAGTFFRVGLISLAVYLFLPTDLGAQCPSAPQGRIVANPNRPMVADPADITELGVLELEYGWERDWFPGAVRGGSFGALVKFAATCNLEIRWSPDTLVTQGGLRGVRRSVQIEPGRRFRDVRRRN